LLFDLVIVVVIVTTRSLWLRMRRGMQSSRIGISVFKYFEHVQFSGGSVAEWLACWTQALKGPGSNRSRDAVG